MKHCFFTLLTGILSCPIFAYAQRPVTFRITGLVADSASREPVAYATITLLKTASLQPVGNTLTDASGHFQLSGLSAGLYRVGIATAGYSTRLLEAITLDTLHPQQELPAIYLGLSTQHLQQVTVTAQRPLLEVKDDRLVYNVENDLNKDNLSAAEMLRRVPLVTVEPDGTILLKGSDQLKVLLNGKSTSVLAKSPKDALRSFPASVIKNIEIITQPSARYDAEGAAGIINIITRQPFSGYNGSLSGSYNSLNYANAAATLNAKAGRLGIAGFISANTFRNKGRSEALRKSHIPDYESTLAQTGSSVFDGTSYYASLELSYDLDSSSSLSLYSNNSIGRNTNNAPQLNLLYPDQQPVQTGYYTSFTHYTSNSYDLGLDYQKRFRQPAYTLSLSLNRNTGRNTIHADNEQLNEPGPDNYLENYNGERNTENTVQLDYAQPLAGGQLETGVKTIFRSIESDYSQQLWPSPDRVLREVGNADTYHYRQDVLAAYTTYRFKIKKQVSVQLGARLEQTYTSAHFNSTDTSLHIGYLHFIPTVNISIPLPGPQSLSLSYSKRLQRPWVTGLNPYVNDNDPYNVSHGNPNLQPETSHSFGANYQLVIGQLSLLVSPDYTFTRKAMEHYLSINSATGVIAASVANIDRRSTTGLNLTASAQLNAHWNFSGNVRGAYTSLQNETGRQLHNAGWSATSYISSDYDLGHGLQVELSFYLNSSRPALQGRTQGYSSHTVSLRKELFHHKAVLSLYLDQPFQREIAWRSVIHDPLFEQTGTFYYPVRALRLGFSWKFGQLKEAVTRKKGVKNDDVKRSDGNQS